MYLVKNGMDGSGFAWLETSWLCDLLVIPLILSLSLSLEKNSSTLPKSYFCKMILHKKNCIPNFFYYNFYNYITLVFTYYGQ